MSKTALDEKLQIRLTTRELTLLDQIRAKQTRATFIRGLIRAEASASTARANPNAKPPTKQDAMKLLASHAEHDAEAAIELVRRLDQDEQAERLRELTT